MNNSEQFGFRYFQNNDYDGTGYNDGDNNDDNNDDDGNFCYVSTCI